MDYLILGSILIITVLLILHHWNKRKSKKNLEELRQNWGKAKHEAFQFGKIRNFANVVTDDAYHRLSDQTIDDVDLFGVFATIDRTTSKVGQQYLFKKLIEPSPKIKNESEELIQLFATDQKLREEVQMELLKLNDFAAYQIPSLLGDRLLQKPSWLNLLFFNLVFSILLILFSFEYPALLVMLIIPVGINMLAHYWNKTNTFQFMRSLPQLNLLIQVSNAISKKGGIFLNKEVEDSIAALKPIQKKISLINFEDSGSVQAELSQIATYFIELIKIFFVIEIVILFHVVEKIEAKRASILLLFNYIGNIDAALSVASLRSGKLRTCQPQLHEEKKAMVARNLYHPLIDNCVANNININGKSILITGSNMSGKSTFLRALTINSILAQTIYTCFADEFISAPFKQHSSIRIDDNIFQGKSYYFEEVKIMGSLIDQVNSPFQNLFVLDEVFKGTNTVERISSAKAILSYLNQNNNIVLVSTHDLELADLLQEEYDLYHFTETVEDNELHFDHIIKWGQLKTGNAIRILELSNYPASIIKEARQLSGKIKLGAAIEEKIEK